jgi:hypothetical protein
VEYKRTASLTAKKLHIPHTLPLPLTLLCDLLMLYPVIPIKVGTHQYDLNFIDEETEAERTGKSLKVAQKGMKTRRKGTTWSCGLPVPETRCFPLPGPAGEAGLQYHSS